MHSFKSFLKSGLAFAIPLAILTPGCGSSENTGTPSSELTVEHLSSDLSAAGDLGAAPVRGKSSRVFVLKNTTAGDFTSLYALTSTSFRFAGGVYPGTGGNCGATLTAGSSCELMLEFSPDNSSAPTTGTLTVYYNTENGDKKIDVPLSARIITGSELEFVGLNSTTSFGNIEFNYSFGKVRVGQTSEATITLKNKGEAPAKDINFGLSAFSDFKFKGGSFPGGGTCGKILEGGSSCTVGITFSPKHVGKNQLALEIKYDNSSGHRPQSLFLNLSGTGIIGAVLSVYPDYGINFGNTALGQTSTYTLKLENYNGTAATDIQGTGGNGVFNFAGGIFPGTHGDCPKTLAPYSQCKIEVSFSPKTGGHQTYSGFSIQYNDGYGLSTLQLPEMSGTGAQKPKLSGFSGDFGDIAVGSSIDQTIVVENDSTTNIHDLVVDPSLLGAFTVKGGTCPVKVFSWGPSAGILHSGSTCTIVVNFRPTLNMPYATNLNLKFKTDAGIWDTLTLPLKGRGQSMASLSFNKLSVNFGSVEVGTSKEETITLTNLGGIATSSITGMIPPGSGISFKNGSFLGSGTCTGTLAPGASCNIVLVFTPGSPSYVNQSLTVTFNNGLYLQNINMYLSGAGIVGPKLSISGFSGDFGEVAIGDSVTRTITIHNNGGLIAKDLQAIALPPPFEFPGGFPGGGTCPVPTLYYPATLAPGMSCTVVITFKPNAVGHVSKNFSLNYSKDPSSPIANLQFPLSGKGKNGAKLSFAVSEFDFGVVEAGSTATKAITVTNSGTDTAHSINFYSSLPALFQVTPGNCPTSLMGGASCEIRATFSPYSVSNHNSSITVHYYDGLTPKNLSLNVKGTGKNAPTPANLFIGGANSNFGIVGVGGKLERTFTISNYGETDATGLASLDGIGEFSFKGGAFPGVGGTCLNTLIQKGMCSVVIEFAPAHPGVINKTIAITYRSGTSAAIKTLNLDLTGIGKATTNALVISGVLGNFGEVKIGKTATRTFTITNELTEEVTGIVFGGISNPFEFVPGAYPEKCTYKLNAGAKCRVSISFTPAVINEVKQTFDIQYATSAGIKNTTFELSGKGVKQTEAALKLALLGNTFEAIDPLSYPDLATLRANQMYSMMPAHSALIPSVISIGHSGKFNYQDVFTALGSALGAQEVWKTQLNVPRVVGYTFRGDARPPRKKFDLCGNEWKNGFKIKSEITGHEIQFPPMIEPGTGLPLDCGIQDVEGFWPTYTRPSDMVMVDQHLAAYKATYGKDFDFTKQNIQNLKPNEMNLVNEPIGLNVADTLNWYLQNVLSVHAHVYNYYKFKGFISTSRSSHFAKNWSCRDTDRGFVYATLVEGGYDMPAPNTVNVHHGSYVPTSFTMSNEREVVAVGSIPWDDVMAYVETQKIAGIVYYTGNIYVRKGFDKMDPVAYARILRNFAGEAY